MSNRKPKIFASCKAGCNWETIHRSEFETAYPYVPVYLNQDGVLNIERNIRYKIYNKSAYTDKYGFSIKINVNGTIVTLNNPTYDKYQNYVFFKLLEFVPNYLGTNKAAMIYELNGVRKTQVIDGDIGLVTYNVEFNPITGEVSGDGVDKFTFSKVETSGGETLKQVSLDIRAGSVELTGDTQFVEDYEVNTGMSEETGEIVAADFIYIQWKTTCTPNEEDIYFGVTHTLVSGSEECWGSFAEAKYTLASHYAIVDYKWDEVDDNAILSSTSVSGSTYIANYCVFSVYVEDLERALICNDDVTFEVVGTSGGVEIVDVTGLNKIPVVYQDNEQLKKCLLMDNGLIYQLSFIDDAILYFVNIDERIYRYIEVNAYVIDRFDDKPLATKEYVDNNAGGITIYTPIREG